MLSRTLPNDRHGKATISSLFTLAFGVLAFGDTFHLVCRFVGYAKGDLDATSKGKHNVAIVGMGAVFTAITVTIFYVLMEMIWQARFQKAYGCFNWILFLMAVIRFALMTAPGNEWRESEPPQTWGIIRNAPLVIQGLCVAFLMLRDGHS